MTTNQRSRQLHDLDGLSLKDTANMPHPVELARWSRDELYEIDADRQVFRLTAKGRLVAQQQ